MIIGTTQQVYVKLTKGENAMPIVPVRETLNPGAEEDNEMLFNMISLDLISNKMRISVIKNNWCKEQLDRTITNQEFALNALRTKMDLNKTQLKNGQLSRVKV